MRSISKKLALLLLVVAAVFLIFPTEQKVAPDWQVTVVDENGVRLAGIGVRETWRQLSVEQKDHEAVLNTDKAGTVHFPARTQKSSYLMRAYGCWQNRRASAAGGCGPRASVWAFGPGMGTLHEEDTRDIDAKWVYQEIQPDHIIDQQTTSILLHHCPPGRFGVGCKYSDTYSSNASSN